MSTGRILIVDDSDNIRNVLQMNFEWLGYEVTCAGDGEEALRRIPEERPDLIVLDVMMPRLNGYQVCRTLKSNPELRDIPVVFLSAKNQQGDRFWGKDCGADAYLTKPFSAAKLERVIQELLEGGSRKSEVGVITAKFRALKAEGRPCSVSNFRLDSKALQVFRQKYGEMRYRDALEGARSTMDSVLRGASSEAVIEMRGEGIFRAALACDSSEAKSIMSRICLQADLLFRSMYSREDAERGYVLARAPEGEEIHVSLLTLQACLIAESSAA
jgi:CheY-like chemotaxis protein